MARLSVVLLAFNPSIQEGETGKSLGIQGQSGPHVELQDSQGNIMRSVFKNNTKNKKIKTKQKRT